MEWIKCILLYYTRRGFKASLLLAESILLDFMWLHFQEIPIIWARDQCNCSPLMGGSEQLSQAFGSAVHSLRSFPAFPCFALLDYLSSLRFPSPLLRSLTTLPQNIPRLPCFAKLDGCGHHIQRLKQLKFLHRSVGSVRFLLWTFHPHECLSISERSSKTPNNWEVWDHLVRSLNKLAASEIWFLFMVDS